MKNTYSNPLSISYLLQALDIGAGVADIILQGPEGGKGRVSNILVYQVTEAFTATTTAGQILVGDGVTATLYANMSTGTTAIGATKSSADTELTYVASGTDELITVSFAAPTGGTPAGIGDVLITIDWFV